MGPYSIFSGPAGSTPVEEDQRPFLVNSAISTRGELDGAEQSNIFKATVWLDQTNIGGVMPREIPFKIVDLCRDVRTMLADTTGAALSNHEVAIRFHHRLVQIHPFANGNGRHSRLVTDKLLTTVGEKKFTWGISTYPDRKALREAYLAALRAADSQYKYDQLLAFARS